MNEYKALMGRIKLASRPVEETFETLNDEAQTAWSSFLTGYAKEVMGMTDEELKRFGGGLAQLWALAHDYYSLFGPLWK